MRTVLPKKINPAEVSSETTASILANITCKKHSEKILSLLKGVGPTEFVSHFDEYKMPECKFNFDIADCRRSSGRRIEAEGFSAPVLYRVANSHWTDRITSEHALIAFEEYVEDNPHCFEGLISAEEAIIGYVDSVDGPSMSLVLEQLGPHLGKIEIAEALAVLLDSGRLNLVSGRIQQSFFFFVPDGEDDWVHADYLEEEESDYLPFSGE